MEKQNLFDYDKAFEVKENLKEKLDFPYVSGYVSALGGRDRASILLTITEDSKETWINGILQNSRYRKIYIENNGRVEEITRSHKIKHMRAFTAKNIKHLLDKINSTKG